MSTSLVSTVLGIEREAEGIIEKAQQDADALVRDAKAKCEAGAETSRQAVEREVKRLEAVAVEERAKKIQELTASGEASLSTVKNISDAAYKKGVKLILEALTGK